MNTINRKFILMLALASSSQAWGGPKKYTDVTPAPWIGNPGINEGWDYSLPANVTPSSRAYIKYGDDPKTKFPMRRLKEVEVSWKDIESEQGKFDFETLRNEIRKVGDEGFNVELHIKSALWEIRKFKDASKTSKYTTNDGTAPRWLHDKLGVPLVEEKARFDQDKPFQLINLDTFDQRYHKAYLDFLRQLKASGIAQMEEIGVAYIHTQSRDKGEEGQIPNKSPEVDMFNERLDAWSDAFGDNTYKLVFTGAWGKSLNHAYELGIGQRNGFVEQYMSNWDNEFLCQSVDENGYLINLEECHQALEGRVFGDENEEYGERWTARFGPFESFPHRYHESMLRVLQMRRNFLWTNEFTFDPNLLGYVALSLGKSVQDSRDAWTYLRESYVEKGKDKVPVKNFERWVFQRDTDGARTVPAEKVTIPKQMTDHHPKALFDYTARRTDSIHGQRAIVFGIYDGFLFGTGHNVTIKVTYLDLKKAEWKLKVPRTNGTCETTVQNKGTKKVMTLTMVCEDAAFLGQDYGEDFRIEALQDDVTVSFVRVIKN